MSASNQIDVSNWQENLSELARLKGVQPSFMLYPPAIGKTKMQEIADALAEERKSAALSKAPG